MAEAKTEERAASEGAERPKPRRVSKRKAVENHVRGYFDALARRDVRAIGEHWREDGVEDMVPIGVMRGRPEIEGFFRDLFGAVPDAEFTVARLIAGDRSAAVEWRMTGTFSGARFQGLDPTGKPVEVRGFDLFEIEDGQIVSNTVYYDGADFGRQVGMLPPQDSGAERAMKSAFNAMTKVRKAVAERTGS